MAVVGGITGYGTGRRHNSDGTGWRADVVKAFAWSLISGVNLRVTVVVDGVVAVVAGVVVQR